MARDTRSAEDRRRGQGQAFTLVELLVVIACMTLLMLLVAGAYEAARDRLNVACCAAKLTRLWSVLFCYTQENGGYLPETGAASTISGPIAPGGFYFPDTWDSPGTAYWPQERRTGNAGNLYLLIRLGLARPEDFICPASGDRPAFGPFFKERFGFLAYKAGSLSLTDQERGFMRLNATRHCSYSYQNVLGHSGIDEAVADPGAGCLQINCSPADLVILADHNPYTQLRGEDRPCLDPDLQPQANSLNHAGRGQNVLRLNGSVAWQTTPLCGAVTPQGHRDDIYRPAAGAVTDSRNVPRHVWDSYLVP